MSQTTEAAVSQFIEDDPVYLPPRLQRQRGITMLEDMNNGDLYLVPYGSGIALVFSGSPDFINRWFNWAINTSVIGQNSSLNWWLDGHPGTVAYICPKSRDVIRRGLIQQFGWEIVENREIEVTRTVDKDGEYIDSFWDEAKVTALAEERADSFMANHIKTTGMVLERNQTLAPIYGTASAGRAEGGWGAGRED